MNVVVAAAALLSIAGSALAVVVVEEGQYIQRPDGAAVGRVGGGSCVPIGARFALTADHVGTGPGKSVHVDGVNYRIKAVHPHPNAPSTDLKVVEIEGPTLFPVWVDVHPDPTSIAYGTPVYIGGWGRITGQADGNCVDWGAREERWAMNELEGQIAGVWSWYRFDIERPNEGIAAVNDSGSPMLISDPATCAVAVVAIASSATSGSAGPSCDNHTAHYVNVDPLWLAQFTGPACIGDFDNDGDTDVTDFSTLLSNFGLSTVAECQRTHACDLNEDGTINVDDVGIFISNFGCTP